MINYSKCIYTGVFNEEYPKRLGYCTDITKLGIYTPRGPDMLYYNIQFAKGKARNPPKMRVIDDTGSPVSDHSMPRSEVVW